MFSRCHFQKVPWEQLKHQRAAKPDQELKKIEAQVAIAAASVDTRNHYAVHRHR